MRIKLDLDQETTNRLVSIALVERRSAADQAAVILEQAIAEHVLPMLRLDPLEVEVAGVPEKA